MADIEVPQYVLDLLDGADARAAFEALSPGEKRAMLTWIESTDDPVHQVNRTKMAIEMYCSPD